MTTPSSSSSSASASASASSSSFNPFKRRVQKEGTSSDASDSGGGAGQRKLHRPRKMQQRSQDPPPASAAAAPIRNRNRAGSAATTGMPHQSAQQTSTPPTPRGAASSTNPAAPPPSSDPINQAHTTLTTLQAQLDLLSATFQLNPSSLQFSPPPNSDLKLAFVPFIPANASYHSYVEDLTKLLLKLDGVDSNGDQGVRQRRKGVVATIERELERVEAIKKGEWERRNTVESELREKRRKVDEMMRGFKGGETAER